MERICGWWGSYPFQGSPNYVMESKLKALKMDLKPWNDQEFGNIYFKQQRLLQSLHELETYAEVRSLTEVENLEKANLIAALEKNTLLDEIFWRQKSRQYCLRKETRTVNISIRLPIHIVTILFANYPLMVRSLPIKKLLWARFLASTRTSTLKNLFVDQCWMG